MNENRLNVKRKNNHVLIKIISLEYPCTVQFRLFVNCDAHQITSDHINKFLFASFQFVATPIKTVSPKHFEKNHQTKRNETRKKGPKNGLILNKTKKKVEIEVEKKPQSK